MQPIGFSWAAGIKEWTGGYDAWEWEKPQEQSTFQAFKDTIHP